MCQLTLTLQIRKEISLANYGIKEKKIIVSSCFQKDSPKSVFSTTKFLKTLKNLKKLKKVLSKKELESGLKV